MPLAGLVTAVDATSRAAGWLAGWLIIPMTVAMSWEVAARYLFNAPTRWATPVATALYGAQFMLAAAYTLLRDGHIRTDVFSHRWSGRTRALVDAVSYVVFFFPGLALVLQAAAGEAFRAWQISERAGPWPAYLIKGVIPLSAALLMLQGLSELVKCGRTIRRGAR